MVNPAAMSSALDAVAKFMGCCAVCVLYRREGRSVKQQGGDRFNACLVCLDGHPWHGVALGGALPDHTVLIELCCQGVGVCHVLCPLTPPLIERSEGLGLDGDGVGHVSFAVERILQGQGRTNCSTVDRASAVTVRAGVLVQNRTPTAARMISRNMVCRW